MEAGVSTGTCLDYNLVEWCRFSSSKFPVSRWNALSHVKHLSQAAVNSPPISSFKVTTTTQTQSVCLSEENFRQHQGTRVCSSVKLMKGRRLMHDKVYQRNSLFKTLLFQRANITSLKRSPRPKSDGSKWGLLFIRAAITPCHFPAYLESPGEAARGIPETYNALMLTKSRYDEKLVVAMDKKIETVSSVYIVRTGSTAG